jgi:hypothetical protein
VKSLIFEFGSSPSLDQLFNTRSWNLFVSLNLSVLLAGSPFLLLALFPAFILHVILPSGSWELERSSPSIPSQRLQSQPLSDKFTIGPLRTVSAFEDCKCLWGL